MRKIQILSLSFGFALVAAPAFAQDTGGTGTGTQQQGTAPGQGTGHEMAPGKGMGTTGDTNQPGATPGQPGQMGTGQTGTGQTGSTMGEQPSGVKGGNLSPQDQRFVENAASSSMLEVHLGQLAMQKSQNKKVKELGAKLVKDHTKSTDNLRKIADQGGFTLPQEMLPADQQSYDRISALEGKEFDQAFLQNVSEGHTTSINEFQSEVTSGQSPALKKFAKDQIKTLKAHHDLANRDAHSM